MLSLPSLSSSFSQQKQIDFSHVKHSDDLFIKKIELISKKKKVSLLKEGITLENRLVRNISVSNESFEFECINNKMTSFGTKYSDQIKREIFRIDKLGYGTIISKSSYIQGEGRGNNFSSLYSKKITEIRTYIEDGEFYNYFSPEIWIMGNNYKKNSPIFFSDIVIKQYEIISKKNGFYGQLPSIICRRNILNNYAKELTSQFGKKEVTLTTNKEKYIKLNKFLQSKELGTSTKRLINTIGMNAVDIDITPYSIYVYLSPNV